MKKIVKRFTVLFVLVMLALAFAQIGCEKGPAEKAGKEIDKAVDTTKDKIDEATK